MNCNTTHYRANSSSVPGDPTDDLGVSRGATLGIIRAHEEGIVTSASLAATTPFYAHALDHAVRPHPTLGIGLHFTLTTGRPVSPAAQVPLLVDGAGVFRWRFVSLLRAAGLRKRRELLDQIGIELEAQIGRLREDGVRIDHIDGERHVHLIPGIFSRVVASARRHGIPFVRAGREIRAPLLTPGRMLGAVAGGGLVKSALLSALSRRAREHLGEGVRTADRFASYLYTGRLDRVMKSILDAPPPGGVTEIMVHPGVPAESRGIDLANAGVERYLASDDRQRELEACLDGRRWTSAWKLTTFGELAREPAHPPR